MTQPSRDAQRDQDIMRADALSASVKSASLGDFVEWLTAFAMCVRRSLVDRESPEPDIARIAHELLDGIDSGLPEKLHGDDADERRAHAARIETFVAALRPVDIADLMDEMAEGYREVLLFEDAARLARFHQSLDGDLALVGSKLVRDLVSLDRRGELSFTPVEADNDMMVARAGSATS